MTGRGYVVVREFMHHVEVVDGVFPFLTDAVVRATGAAEGGQVKVYVCQLVPFVPPTPVAGDL